MEEYSGSHSESVEQLMNWPALRFERFYEAFQKRAVVEELTQRKLMMINALYSNSNYDGENSKVRDETIERIENQFNDSVMRIYNGASDDEEIDKDNPFYAAMDRGLKRQGVPSLEEMEGVEVQHPTDFMPDIDIDQA